MIRLNHKSKLDRLMFPSRLSFQPILILILFIIYAYVPSFVFAASPEEKEIKNVLVVNSYHPGYEWSDDIVKGIQSVLGENNFNIFIEYLDSKRYFDENYFKQLEKILHYKYSTAKIDAIIVSDHHAFYLMLEIRKTFHADVPLVFCGIDRIDPEDLADYKPIYGVLEGDSGIRSTLDLILSIHPGIKKIFFVADQTMSAEVMLNYVRDYEPSYKEIVTFDYLINMSTDELKAALKKVPQNSVVMWLHFIKDKNGNVFSVTESQTYVASNASVPVYACYGFSAGTGIVGGSIIHGFTQGEKAAQIARELLNKENIVPIPLSQQSPFTNMFDYQVMQRFKIGVNDIPENSVIYNKPFSIYEKYRWRILGIVILVIVQALLVGFLLINRVKRRQVEMTLRASEERFRATFEQAAVGIAHVSPEGRFLRINQKICDIVGYSKDEMLELTFQDITHPDDLDADHEHIRRLLAGEAETYALEKRYFSKNGEIVWVNLTVSLVRNKAGEPQWFVSVVKDINERKKMEMMLEKNEAHLRRAQEVARSGSWELDIMSGKLFWSDEVYRIFGVAQENPLSYEDFLKTVLPEDREYVDRSWQDALRGEPYDIEHRIRTDGEVKWLRERAQVEFDGAGRAVRGIGIVQDITERKQAEQTVQKYQERLKALASQLTLTEEKERRRIADDLHDQIGQSLALARMQIAAACKSATDAGLAGKLDDISENLREAVHDTRHLMFDLSPPAMHQIGLGAAISEWLEDQIEKRYGIKTEFFDNLDKSHRKVLDENVRAILFRNVRELLVNVVKHAQANQVTVLMELTDGVLKIVVQDDGIGFDYLLVSQKGGTGGGFGLFSIEERMTDLGGALEIESQPGKGCKAIISVPLRSDDDGVERN